MLDTLTSADRMRLLQFVCSFAWSDFMIAGDERQYVERVVRMLELADAERAEVLSWLETPPSAEAVDPSLIPNEHRELFVKAVEGVVAADAEFASEERDQLIIFKQILRNRD